MPLVKKAFLVAICPRCKNKIDVNGEGGYTVFDTKAEWDVYMRESGCTSIADYCGCERREECRAKRKSRGLRSPEGK